MLWITLKRITQNQLRPNRQTTVNRLVVMGAVCLLCVVGIPSESKKTKALQRRSLLNPSEQYLLAAEISAQEDRSNTIMLRTIFGLALSLNVLAISSISRARNDEDAQAAVSVLRPVAKLFFGTLKYFASSLLGILMALLITGSAGNLSEDLSGFDNLIAVIFSIIPGLYTFLVLLISESPKLLVHAWWVLPILLLPFLCEVLTRFQGRTVSASWRPFWIGFPVGFLGTIGIYWEALKSL